MDKMSSSRKSATFDQQSAARMALPNCLVERLILVYLNVVGGWCAALKGDISMESVIRMDKEEEEEEEDEKGEDGTEGEGVVGDTAGELKRVMEQGVDSADLEPRFADLAAVDRILAVLSQSPLGSWVLQKRAPTLTIATHVRLLTDSHYLVLSSVLHPASIILIDPPPLSLASLTAHYS
jgi:hypothetical protein